MEKKYDCFFAAMRGICIALFTISTSAVTTLITYGLVSVGFSLLKGVEDSLVYILCTAAIPFIFNSFALAFAYSDRRRIEEFIERGDMRVTFLGEMKAVFASRTVMCELFFTHMLILLASLLGAFFSFGGMFPAGMPLGNILPAITVTPVCFALSLLSKYEAARYHDKLNRDGDIEKLLSLKWLVIRIVILVSLYPFVTPLAPILLFAAISVFAILAKLSNVLTVLGVILAFAALIFAIWGIKVLRGISIRKRFLKKLLIAAEKSGCKVCEIKNPYRSFATSKNHCKFTVRDEDNEFECIVISTLWHGARLIFTSPTDACFEHRLGTKNHHITLRHNIEFYHHSSGGKIIIVNPVPRDVYIEDEGKQDRIYCSDSIWKIVVHDEDSFIGCMERHCLDRKK